MSNIKLASNFSMPVTQYGSQANAILGIRDSGKALAVDTPIPTPTGWKTMGELKVGDVIFDESGQPCKVLYVTEYQLNRDCYNVLFSDGSVIVADADHLWLTHSYKSRTADRNANAKNCNIGGRKNRPQCVRLSFPSLVTTAQIKDSLFDGTPKYKERNHAIINSLPLALPDADLPIPPYTLGCWLGDGTSINATITVCDDEILSEIKNDSFTISPTYAIAKTRREQISYRIRKGKTGITLHQILREQNLLNNKHIPNIYLRSSIHQRLELLKGLMDTDGTIQKNSNSCIFYNTNKNICDGVYELVCSLGWSATMRIKKGMYKGIRHKDCYEVRFRPTQSVFKLKRKSQQFNFLAGHSKRRAQSRFIIDVTKADSVPVKCIKVSSPNSLFLCGKSMIPTHNTYTATKAGEELMDAGVPIVVFDPVGVWKNLRIGTKPHKGYPIIIAGGDDTADIRITPENAKDIIRAAMKARVSIIIDLFSAELANKSKWVKIVQECLDVLFYENKNHGLIHVFIEEASEFIPQRIMPERYKVYSSVERVARMGRNSSIGMTIINQRAEEVNKAILELCALTFMHKQTGKNSLTSIEKWMDKLGVYAKEKYTELPNLKQGECLVIDTNNQIWFKKIKILPKNTFHPSPEMGTKGVSSITKTQVNISSFIDKLKKQLQPVAEKVIKKQIGVAAMPPNTEETQALKRENAFLKSQLKQKEADYHAFAKKIGSTIERIDLFIAKKTQSANQIFLEIQEGLKQYTSSISISTITNIPDTPKQLFSDSTDQVHSESKRINVATISNTGFLSQPGLTKMIKILSMHRTIGITKERLAIVCGMVPTSGTFKEYFRQLKRQEYFQADQSGNSKFFFPTNKCYDHPAVGLTTPDIDKDAVLATWYDILGNGGKTKILQCIADNPPEISLEQIGHIIGMSHTSGTFLEYYRQLKRKNLVQVNNKMVSLSEHILAAN